MKGWKNGSAIYDLRAFGFGNLSSYRDNRPYHLRRQTQEQRKRYFENQDFMRLWIAAVDRLIRQWYDILNRLFYSVILKTFLRYLLRLTLFLATTEYIGIPLSTNLSSYSVVISGILSVCKSKLTSSNV